MRRAGRVQNKKAPITRGLESKLLLSLRGTPPNYFFFLGAAFFFAFLVAFFID